MIDVRTATKQAIQFVGDLHDGDASVIRSIRVEEVMTNRDDQWLITLSFIPTSTFAERESDRQFKVFEVNGQSGEVMSMKIREMSA